MRRKERLRLKHLLSSDSEQLFGPTHLDAWTAGTGRCLDLEGGRGLGFVRLRFAGLRFSCTRLRHGTNLFEVKSEADSWCAKYILAKFDWNTAGAVKALFDEDRRRSGHRKQARLLGGGQTCAYRHPLLRVVVNSDAP